MGKYLLLSFFMVFVMAMIPRSFRWTAIALTLAIASAVVATLPSDARYRPPSNLQRPDGRQGAATRNPICVKDRFVFEPVVPTSNYGQTTEAFPTFYWYLANHAFSWARFELYAVQPKTLKQEPDPVYQTTFRLKSNKTLASLTLPKTSGFPPLEKGRDYLWKVTLICSQGGPDDVTANGSQLSVQSWITRVEPRAGLNMKLVKNPRRYDVYAEEGLWYDAVYDLAVQRQQQPQQSRLATDWHDLLQETMLRSFASVVQ
jgi:Domain of Unknown Function (DUF928)